MPVNFYSTLARRETKKSIYRIPRYLRADIAIAKYNMAPDV